MPQMTDMAANSSHACRVMCAGAATRRSHRVRLRRAPTPIGVHRRDVLDPHSRQSRPQRRLPQITLDVPVRPDSRLDPLLADHGPPGTLVEPQGRRPGLCPQRAAPGRPRAQPPGERRTTDPRPADASATTTRRRQTGPRSPARAIAPGSTVAAPITTPSRSAATCKAQPGAADPRAGDRSGAGSPAAGPHLGELCNTDDQLHGQQPRTTTGGRAWGSRPPPLGRSGGLTWGTFLHLIRKGIRRSHLVGTGKRHRLPIGHGRRRDWRSRGDGARRRRRSCRTGPGNPWGVPVSPRARLLGLPQSGKRSGRPCHRAGRAHCRAGSAGSRRRPVTQPRSGRPCR